jgi:hypothetical protein
LADLLIHRSRPRSVAARVIHFDRLVVTS